MGILRLALVALPIFGFCLAEPASAQSPGENPASTPPAASEPRISPEAQRVLDRLRAHYAAIPAASVKATMTISMPGGGEQKQAMSIAAAKPNHLAVHPSGTEASSYALVCDGTTLWQYFGAPLNKYEGREAPKSLSGVIDAAMFGQEANASMVLMQPQLLVPALMDGARLDKISQGANRITYVGKEDVSGKAHDRIRITTDEFAADFWVPADGDAWLRRMRPDLSKMFGGAEAGEQQPEMTVAYDEWTRADTLPVETFAFTPPEGAEKVASLMDALQAQGGDGNDNYEALLGKAAPELDLELLDGGKVSLAAHKGKNVVVLDFWATWCGPCVRALPLVSKAAADLKEKGVVFYAVNQQESPEVIREFLKRKDLTIPVALDKDGKIGNAYGVSGIPQTVLIGRDGTVQAVHVGFMPGMESELTEQLKTLLDNKPLAKPAKTEGAKPDDGKP